MDYDTDGHGPFLVIPSAAEESAKTLTNTNVAGYCLDVAGSASAEAFVETSTATVNFGTVPVNKIAAVGNLNHGFHRLTRILIWLAGTPAVPVNWVIV